jgi:KaiC/GvpD/RAD55 family RecA-like ATPase
VDLDKAFVSALLRAGIDGLKQAQDKGVHADLLQDEGRRVYDFVLDYYQQYSAFPTPDLVEGKLGISLEDPPAPVGFFADEIINRQLHTKLAKTYQDGVKHLELNNPRAALDSTQSAIYELERQKLTASRVISMPSLGDDVLEFYRKIKAGERGVLTPWPSLNEATFGFWPEDLILFVARTGVGKTWMALILAHYAWTQGHKVLFVTTEVGKLAMGIRWAALATQISYSELRHGALSTMDEDKLVTGLNDFKNIEGFDIVGGDFDFRIETLDIAIAEAKPDLVVADGATMFRSEGSNRTERAANTMDDMKRTAKRRAVPLILTTQFNREVKSGSKAGAMSVEKIAQTDASGWNADQVYALYQTKEMLSDRRMGFKPMKVREGFAEDWEVTWDLDRMDFTEIPKQSGQGDAAEDDYDTGIGAGATPMGDTDDAPF